MNLLCFAVLVFSAISIGNAYVSESDVIKEEWQAFKAEFNKLYEEAEDLFRMKVFMENKHKIAHHNKMYLTGHKSYSLAMNKFGDLLHHEFISAVNGFRRNYNESLASGSTFLTPANIQLPENVNWTAKGYVTPVKDQGQCGSCWSFSATGALEGQHFRKTGKLVSLTFEYIKENHGIDTEEAYPYKAKQGRCHYKKKERGATDTGFVDIPSGDEQKLMEAVATIGPVSVAIDASHETFQFYSKGVYNEPECSSQELDHGVLVTGYGTTKNGEDYWIVKNSWGTSWGDDGYIKMSRNKENQCGIATQASYPLV
ncbi:Cathepsin L like protein [Argiope bruennichi]|uniref:Cathepsin L like protein n=1 Tax=Argiope bruennichi TaxID=94029 RepID=A0A8T0G2L3_ARGBR|nr:Cathepsin L like protein [Argiope bruennichi]